MLKISLSAGHGLNTPGKRTPDGMHEWEFNSKVVSFMMKLLADYSGVAVIRLDDPTGNTDISLKDRTARSNAFSSDVHIDIHANANGSTWNDANGIETFVYLNPSTESKQLANIVQDSLVGLTGLRDRGVKTGDLHMVREPHAKAKILVECGFMTNKNEAEYLKTDSFRLICAKAIVNGLVQAYDLKKTTTRLPAKAYYLKTGSFPNKEMAEKMAKELKDKYGWITHVMEVE